MKYLFKPGIFKQQRQLTVTPDYVEYLKDAAFSRLYKKDIVDIKYYYEYLRWSTTITYGIKYRVALMDKHGKTMDVVFKQYRYARENSQHFEQITNELDELYLSDITSNHLRKLVSNQPVTIGKLSFDLSGISMSGNSLSFTWTDLHTEIHPQYFILTRKSAPEFKLHVHFNEWHAQVWVSVIQSYVKSRKLKA
jgi:hypothetical protein